MSSAGVTREPVFATGFWRALQTRTPSRSGPPRARPVLARVRPPPLLHAADRATGAQSVREGTAEVVCFAQCAHRPSTEPPAPGWRGRRSQVVMEEPATAARGAAAAMNARGSRGRGGGPHAGAKRPGRAFQTPQGRAWPRVGPPPRPDRRSARGLIPSVVAEGSCPGGRAGWHVRERGDPIVAPRARANTRAALALDPRPPRSHTHVSHGRDGEGSNEDDSEAGHGGVVRRANTAERAKKQVAVVSELGCAAKGFAPKKNIARPVQFTDTMALHTAPAANLKQVGSRAGGGEGGRAVVRGGGRVLVSGCHDERWRRASGERQHVPLLARPHTHTNVQHPRPHTRHAVLPRTNTAPVCLIEVRLCV